MRTIEHWIGGKTTSGTPSGTAPVWDPATGTQQAEVVLGTAADVEEAVTGSTSTPAPRWSRNAGRRCRP